LLIKKKICVLHDTDELQFIWKNVKGIGKVCKQCYLKKCVKRKPTVPRKPIPARSSKKIDQDKEYTKLRKKFLNDNPMCEAHLMDCLQKATEVHHKKGRTGDLYLDVQYFLAICNSCHRKITDDSKMAIELGLSEYRNK
jgi:hypothetical protein